MRFRGDRFVGSQSGRCRRAVSAAAYPLRSPDRQRFATAGIRPRPRRRGTSTSSYTSATRCASASSRMPLAVPKRGHLTLDNLAPATLRYVKILSSRYPWNPLKVLDIIRRLAELECGTDDRGRRCRLSSAAKNLGLNPQRFSGSAASPSTGAAAMASTLTPKRRESARTRPRWVSTYRKSSATPARALRACNARE